MPKVSVIVPVYNVEKYIERCARSLFEQTLDDIEYIFVDDCSTDNSISVLQSVLLDYQSRKSSVIILHHETNMGPSVTRNDGMLAATGKYIIFCDADDYIDRNMYKLMFQKAELHDADIVACGIRGVIEAGNEFWDILFNADVLSRDSLYEYDKVEGGIYSSTCNKLIKREFINKYKLCFDTSTTMWEDLYMTLRARYYSSKMYIVDLPLYNYCLHEDSIVHSSVLSRVTSQVKVVRLIEDFFISNNCKEEFIDIIAFLKFKSKEALLKNNYALWKEIFPEARKYIFSLISCHGPVLTVKYFLYSYMGVWGYYVYNTFARVKAFLNRIIH